VTARESESKQGQIGEVSGRGVVSRVSAFPLEPVTASLWSSPPFNANVMGNGLTQRHAYTLESLTQCARKWAGRKKVSKINPGNSAKILA